MTDEGREEGITVLTCCGNNTYLKVAAGFRINNNILKKPTLLKFL